MTIKYVADQNCLRLRLLDAFTYVKCECQGSLLESLAAVIFGRSITVSEAMNYVSNGSDSVLVERFKSVLLSRNIVQVSEETVPSSNVITSSAEFDQVNECNEKLKTECSTLEETKRNLISKIDSKKRKAEQYREQINNNIVEGRKSENEIEDMKNHKKIIEIEVNKAKIELDKECERFEYINQQLEGTRKNDIGSEFKDYVSDFRDNKWKDLYTEVSQHYTITNGVADGIGNNAKAGSLLLNILKDVEVESNKIIQGEKIKVLKSIVSDNSEKYSIEELWEKHKKGMVSQFVSDKEKFDIYLQKLAQSIELKYGISTNDCGHLMPGIKMAVRVTMLMMSQSLHVRFSSVPQGDVFSENEFVICSEAGSKECEVDFMLFPALITQENDQVQVIVKGMVKKKAAV
ncbi:MAG: hypothetical protein KAG53_11280 [Endozoicomonadaceae bacterium]|nr:hypothetical protein [Endozoicomonadaceae bacterium]